MANHCTSSYEVSPDTENPISNIEGEFSGNKILLAEMEINEDVRQHTVMRAAQGEDGEADEQYDANLLYGGNMQDCM